MRDREVRCRNVRCRNVSFSWRRVSLPILCLVRVGYRTMKRDCDLCHCEGAKTVAIWWRTEEIATVASRSRNDKLDGLVELCDYLTQVAT